LQWLTEFATENRIQLATLFVIGAVRKAAVAFYDQQQKVYRQINIEKNLEILSCAGNVTVKDNSPFIHCHAGFSDHEGGTFGGHLANGTIVFAAEAYFQELLGTKLVREYDPVTGLALWKEV
jgi:hypothetical protein